jgi:polyisoprenoid-binding protein YceI
MNTLTATKWAIDPTHSEVGFKVKHMMISTVKGHFESLMSMLNLTMTISMMQPLK